MCQLFSNMTSHEAMTKLFGVHLEFEMANSKPAIFPKNKTDVVTVDTVSGQRKLGELAWGFLLPQKSKRTGQPIKPKAVINARSETIMTSPFWRDSFRSRRCLVPATAYCETTGRQPAICHWFGVADNGGKPEPFAFAGLWKTFEGERTSQGLRQTFAIATTQANDFTRPYHKRMPVILNREQYEQWLLGSPSEAVGLLKPLATAKMVLLAQGENVRIGPDLGLNLQNCSFGLKGQ